MTLSWEVSWEVSWENQNTEENDSIGDFGQSVFSRETSHDSLVPQINEYFARIFYVIYHTPEYRRLEKNQKKLVPISSFLEQVCFSCELWLVSSSRVGCWVAACCVTWPYVTYSSTVVLLNEATHHHSQKVKALFGIFSGVIFVFFMVGPATTAAVLLCMHHVFVLPHTKNYQLPQQVDILEWYIMLFF